MAIQAIAIVEEVTRGTFPGSPTYNWLPVTGTLFPTFTPTDEARSEFRGNDSALGNSEDSLVRRESQTTYALECAAYPGIATGLLFKYLLGKEGTRAVVETTAFKGPLYPLAQPFGEDNELVDGALSIVVLYDKEGTTFKKIYSGLRDFDFAFAAEGTDDIKFTFNMKAPGEFISAEAVNDLTPDYSGLVDPYTSSDLLCYIGTGASLTGTAPDYTDIAPGTMDQFCPDSVNFTLVSGLDDKVQMCGVQGPGKTFRSAQFTSEINLPIDLEDPDTGFSSWDEFEKIFIAPSSNILMFVLDNGVLAGDTSVTYSMTFYFPAVLFNPDTPEVAPDGTQPTINLNYTSLFDNVAEKPFIMQTIDQESAY